MSTITIKVLAQGQLPAVKTTLYTVPAATAAYVKFFSINNVSAVVQNVEILVNTAGTSRRISYTSLGPNEGARIIDKDEALTLEAGDIIEGLTTNILFSFLNLIYVLYCLEHLATLAEIN